MKKKKNRQKQRKRYYDYRLVLLFVCLFAVFFALSYLRSRLLHTPLLGGWKVFWDAPQSTLTSLNYCLVFFEVLLTWAAAGVLCADDKAVGDVDKDYSSALWTSALTGLPLGINCVSDLSVWAYYSVFMLVTAWLIGKEIGESPKQIQRFLKVTELLPEFLEMLDEGKVSFNPAFEIAFLTKDKCHISSKFRSRLIT